MNRKELIFLGGLLGGIGATLLGQKLIKKKKIENTQSRIVSLDQEEQLLQEQLVRNVQFFGQDGQVKIEQAHIMIFGVGGVGSHVTSAIARAGVRKITIIDFDRVTLSSLNRHALATRKDVGRSKVEIFEAFIKDLNPKIQLHMIEAYISPENISEFFTQKPDYVIDCIDNIDAKTALAAYCVQNNIKIMVCCGAGMKCDPTRLQIRDISESQDDGLARALRTRLKKLHIKGGFNVIYSTETSDRQLLPLQEHQLQNPEDYRIMPNYRLRIVPVFGCMPALFAQSLSSYVLCDIAGCAPKTLQQNDIKMPYFVQQIQLVTAQAKKNKVEVNLDIEDLVLIFKAYQGCCLVKNKKTRPLEIIQFDNSKDIDPFNLILLSSDNAAKYKKRELVLSSEMLNRKSNYDQIIKATLGTRIFA